MCNYFVKLVRKRIKHRYEGKTEKSQTPAFEIRNLSLGCLKFFRLALLTVLDPLYPRNGSPVSLHLDKNPLFHFYDVSRYKKN